jgi:hypothetical protein
MGNSPTAAGLDAETRELLATIRDALDLPHAATAADDEKRERLRGDNAVRVVSSLDYLLTSKHADVALVARMLRDMVAEHPPTYKRRSRPTPPPTLRERLRSTRRNECEGEGR